MIGRREFVLAFAAAPLVSFAQTPKVWRVGFLAPRSRPASLDGDLYGAFLAGMGSLGYVEGKNLTIEWRFAGNDSAMLSKLAGELVQLKPDVIVTPGSAATSAAQKATASLPVVMINAGDPVRSGYGRSLAHPGGNITGPTSLMETYSAKQLEVIREIVPNISRVAVLSFNFSDPVHAAILKNVEGAARSIAVSVLPFEARDAGQLAATFAAMATKKVDAVMVAQNPFFLQVRRQLSELATT